MIFESANFCISTRWLKSWSISNCFELLIEVESHLLPHAQASAVMMKPVAHLQSMQTTETLGSQNELIFGGFDTKFLSGSLSSYTTDLEIMPIGYLLDLRH